MREIKYAREISIVWNSLRETASEATSAQSLVNDYARSKGLDVELLTIKCYELIGLENWFGVVPVKTIDME